MDDADLNVEASLASNAPVPIPMVVRREGCLIVPVLFVGTIPLAVFLILLFDDLAKLPLPEPIRSIFSFLNEYPFFLTLASILLLAYSIMMLLKFEQSRYAWNCARYYIGEGMTNEAELVLLGNRNGLSLIHRMLFPKLRAFIRERNLSSKLADGKAPLAEA